LDGSGPAPLRFLAGQAKELNLHHFGVPDEEVRPLAFPMLVLVYLRQFSCVLSGVDIFNLSGMIFFLSIILIGLLGLFAKPQALENIRLFLWQRRINALP